MPISKIKTSSILADAASTNLNIDAGTLFLDTTNNFVGIGTTTPSNRLTVVAPVNTNSYAQIYASGTGNSYLGLTALGGTTNELSTNTAGDFVITSAGIASDVFKMVHTGAVTSTMVLNSGNVGIGTASPATRLDVYTTTASTTTGVLKLYGANGADRYTGIDFHGVTSETYNKIAQITALVSNGGSGGGTPIGGDLIFRTNNSSSNVPTEKMRIVADGTVGIGTASPSTYGAKLAIYSAASSTANIQITNPGIGTGTIGLTAASSNFKIYNSYASGTLASGAGIDIDTSGNVGIGVTSVPSKLYVSTTSSTAYGLIIQSQVVGLTAGNYVNMAYFTDSRSTNNDGLRIVNVRDSTGSGTGNWETASYRIRRSVDQNDAASGVQEEIVFGANLLAFSTGGSERMRIDTNGNVGIGNGSTVTASKQLYTYTTANSLQIQSVVRNSNTGTGVAAIGFNVAHTSEGDYTQAGIGLVRGIVNGSGALCFYNKGSGTASDFTTADEKMRIDSSGNVGIGVTPSTTGALPRAIEFSYGALTSYNSTEFNMSANTYITTGSWTYKTTAPVSVYQQSGGQHNFFTAASGTAGTTASLTSRMTITNAGNVTMSGSLSVNTANNDPGINGVQGFTVSSGGYMTVCRASPVIYAAHTTTGNLMEFRANGTTLVGTIGVSGSATTYATSSDYRLKEDIAPMTGALEKVAALKPVTYKWKVDGSDGEGFIAHELAEVCPHAVIGEKDATQNVEIKDDEGNVTGTELRPSYQGIDTSFLIATLTAAIQEQQAIITTLTERISALETK